MTQAKYKTLPTLLKCLFIAVPAGMLIAKVGCHGHNTLIVIGVVWFLSLAITARTRALKSLFIAIPGGIILATITISLIAANAPDDTISPVGQAAINKMTDAQQQAVLNAPVDAATKAAFAAMGPPDGRPTTPPVSPEPRPGTVNMMWAWVSEASKSHPFIVKGIVWLVSTGIVWLVCLGIMRLIDKFARKSKLDNTTVESTSEKSCPYCAETIKFAATLCRYCRSSLDTPIQDKHVFACILLAIFIACFYVSKAIGDTSIWLSDIASTINSQTTADYSSELSDIADAIRSR